MINVKLFALAGVLLTLLLIGVACSPAPLTSSEMRVATTPTIARARYGPPPIEWIFLAKERGVATGHGASFAVQFIVMEARDPSPITVIYTLAAEPGIETGQKQLTPVDATSLVDQQQGRAYPWVTFTNLGRLDDVEIGALGFQLDREGVKELTLAIPALETADGQQVVEGPWELPLFKRYPVSEQPPTHHGLVVFREGYAFQSDAKISFNGWGIAGARSGDRVADILADVGGMSEEEEEAIEWGLSVEPGEETATVPTPVALVEPPAQPQPTPTPVVAPGSPLLTGWVGTLRFESITDPSRVQYLSISVSRDGDVAVVAEE